MTDTNRLARAREFLEQRFRMQEPYPTQIAQIMQDFAEREVKAAVEWTPVEEGLPEGENYPRVEATIRNRYGEVFVGIAYWLNGIWDAEIQGQKVLAWRYVTPYQPKEEQDAAKMS